MCGITGAFNYRDGSGDWTRDDVVRMTRLLAHRGPDGEGVIHEGPVALGHRRLAIVDLSATGFQPMETLDRRAVMVYNGEFYNHLEFRPRLEARGVRFRGSSDTETLLYLMAEYGRDALKDVAGIFGFAFWDRRLQRLHLARDPIGVKQVYFHDDGRRLVFASEIKALVPFPGVPARPDVEGVNQYLHFHTPLFDRTLFHGISQLQPAETMEVTGSGTRKKRYWALDGFEPKWNDPGEAIDDLRGTLSKVVREQLMSDVPVGAFFSGGIDSSAVVSFATRSTSPIQCFGVHFSGYSVVDERPYQEAAARAIGVPLTLISVSSKSFPEDMARLLYYQDQPIIGAAMIPMYHVSRLAAGHVKVCLGGQAGDEIFGGYGRYGLAHPWATISRWMSGRAQVPSSVVGDGLLSPASSGSGDVMIGGNLFKQLLQRKNLRRLVRAYGKGIRPGGLYFSNFAEVSEREWLQVFAAREMVSRNRAWETFSEGIAASPAPDIADRILQWDQRTYLPGLLSQDDRMSMANSLESRVPLADPRIVRFAAHVPFEWKFRAGASKWILRQAVSTVIPEAVLNRRKVGFDTPAEDWMKTMHADWVRDTLTGTRARSRGYFDMAGVKSLLDSPDRQNWFPVLWKLLSLEVWAQQILDGDGFDNHALTRRVEAPSAA